MTSRCFGIIYCVAKTPPAQRIQALWLNLLRAPCATAVHSHACVRTTRTPHTDRRPCVSGGGGQQTAQGCRQRAIAAEFPTPTIDDHPSPFDCARCSDLSTCTCTWFLVALRALLKRINCPPQLPDDLKGGKQQTHNRDMGGGHRQATEDSPARSKPHGAEVPAGSERQSTAALPTLTPGPPALYAPWRRSGGAPRRAPSTPPPAQR